VSIVSFRQQLGRAVDHWKTEGPGWAAQIAAAKFSKFVEVLHPVLSPMTYKSVQMLLNLGYWPNIRNPRTLNEKIAHRQLLVPHPLASLVSDKWRVRQYVAERGPANILNEVYFTTDDPERIPFDDLPDQFVIKANHGSGWNIFVTDKRTLDRKEVIRLCWDWLSHKYSKATRSHETHYDRIAPLILVERFIEDREHGVPVDYKFFCFHGSVHLVQVDLGRFGEHTRVLFDREWRDTSIQFLYPRRGAVPRPPRLAEMVRVAERLSVGFDFCRVDLYAPDPERILFGEITMNPEGGLGRLTPREWDFRLGKLW